jgi:hypothetical protein
LKSLDDESAGKTILESILIFHYLKCGINKNIVWLFEIHEPSPRPNTVILIKFMAVTSGKHSEHDTEPVCFVICTLLEPLRHRKLHCTTWSNGSGSSVAICVRFAEDFRSMLSPLRWSVSVGCLPFSHIETAQCSTGPVALSSCTVQI